MYSVKAAQAITEACDRVMDSKLKSALCKEIVTPLIDSLVFLGLVSPDIKPFQKGLSQKQITWKDEPIDKINVPAKSEWLFIDDMNNRINTVSSKNTALTANLHPHYQYDKYQGSKTGRNQQHCGSKNFQPSLRGSAQGKRWQTQSNRFHRNQKM